jgi:hypothetical protein
MTANAIIGHPLVGMSDRSAVFESGPLGARVRLCDVRTSGAWGGGQLPAARYCSTTSLGRRPLAESSMPLLAAQARTVALSTPVSTRVGCHARCGGRWPRARHPSAGPSRSSPTCRSHTRDHPDRTSASPQPAYRQRKRIGGRPYDLSRRHIATSPSPGPPPLTADSEPSSKEQSTGPSSRRLRSTVEGGFRDHRPRGPGGTGYELGGLALRDLRIRPHPAPGPIPGVLHRRPRRHPQPGGAGGPRRRPAPVRRTRRRRRGPGTQLLVCETPPSAPRQVASEPSAGHGDHPGRAS